MCDVILRVTYKAGAEPAALIQLDDIGAADRRVLELQQSDTIKSISLYVKKEEFTGTIVWQTQAQTYASEQAPPDEPSIDEG